MALTSALAASNWPSELSTAAVVIVSAALIYFIIGPKQWSGGGWKRSLGRSHLPQHMIYGCVISLFYFVTSVTNCSVFQNKSNTVLLRAWREYFFMNVLIWYWPLTRWTGTVKGTNVPRSAQDHCVVRFIPPVYCSMTSVGNLIHWRFEPSGIK